MWNHRCYMDLHIRHRAGHAGANIIWGRGTKKKKALMLASSLNCTMVKPSSSCNLHEPKVKWMRWKIGGLKPMQTYGPMRKTILPYRKVQRATPIIVGHFETEGLLNVAHVRAGQRDKGSTKNGRDTQLCAATNVELQIPFGSVLF